jgi:uncharacterized protein (DUF2235 family)
MKNAAQDISPSRRPKTIVVFSDGTGNSAAKLNKTNVWRLYQALDLEVDPAAGVAPQIALYDGGVGTSGFQPLAILGGVFGVGLKKNVLDLYCFLCRNYQPGDRIFAFGFSRGAFTVRVLAGLVLRVGLVRYDGEAHLGVQANMAYREYRRGFKAANLAGMFRMVRDGAIAAWRVAGGKPAVLDTVRVDRLAFVGVWDTVAAYGMPVAEMTRAVDRWVWPLSMPNYVLSPRVDQARHALALDDERDTFHPLLWDEVAEAEAVAAGKVVPGRLKQVWFAGVHSDVGGGYPDDSLAYVSLAWMMGEAEASGLRLKPGARPEVEAQQYAYGPMHDSRAGMGTYYRYQPRKLSARLEPPDKSTLLMQDPTREAAHGRLLDIVVHDSVIDRIRSGPDGYAPVTLPAAFSVWQGGNAPRRVALAEGSDRVWNEVWRRRVNYFLGLGVTLLLLLMPLLPVSDCNGPQCFLAGAMGAIGGFLPGFVRPWLDAWAANPSVFVVLAVLMMATLAKSKALQRSTDDLMSMLWARTLQGDTQAPAPLAGKELFILRLRTSAAYQRSIQWLKWRAAPGVFAAGFLVFGAIGVTAVVHRLPLLVIDPHAKYCLPAQIEGAAVMASPTAAVAEFSTDNPCWSSGLAVEEGVHYRLRLNVTQPWLDKDTRASPAGFESTSFGVLGLVFAPLRRDTAARWFQPLVTLRDDEGHAHTFAVAMQADAPGQSTRAPGAYSGHFTAPVSGQVFLFVNDVLVPWWPGNPPRFYENNKGSARVTLERKPPGAAGPN